MLVVRIWYCYSYAYHAPSFTQVVFSRLWRGGSWTLAVIRYVTLQCRSRKRSCLFLAFFWVSGLFLGMAAFSFGADTLAGLMRRCFFCNLPYEVQVGVVITSAFLSALVAFYSDDGMLLLLCFGKAFLFGFVSLGVLYSFGSAGWLISFLLLFCNYTEIPFLYLFWTCSLQHPGTKCHFIIRSILLSIACIGLLLINYSIISPILACLIDY